MRNVPQYVQQLSISSMPQQRFVGAPSGLSVMSKELNAISSDMAQKSARIEELQATTRLRENLNRMATESGADVNGLKSKVDGFKRGFLNSIENQELAATFEAKYGLEALPYIDRATQQYKRNLDIEHEKTVLLSNAQNITSVGNIAPNLLSPVPEVRKAAQDAFLALAEDTAANATERDSDGNYLFTPQQQIEMAGNLQKELIVMLPPEKQLKVLSGSGGFESAMATVLEHEGGYSPSDGGTGVAVNFGINQEANPDIDVASLTQEQAVKIYKERYWDANGMDSVPANVQEIVFDGAVNHGNTFRKKLLAAAKDGASASELIEMRRDEYERLAKSGKYPENVVRSWNNRLANLEYATFGDHLNLISPTAKQRIVDSARKALEVDYKLRQDDPVKWGTQRGLNTDQIVAMQPDPNYASVLSKTDAKTTAEQLGKLENTDQFIEAANGFVQQHGQYSKNAIRDLSRQGLKPELEEALLLSAHDPVTYNEQISTLVNASKLSDGDLNQALKDRNDSPETIRGTVIEAMADEPIFEVQQFEYDPSARTEYAVKQQNLAVKMAKTYMLSNPNASDDDAAEFAIRATRDQYGIGQLNGAPYKVPNLYKVDDLEDRLEQFYEGTVRDKFKKEGYYFVDVVPVLNEDEQSYRFVDSLGNPVMSEGEPVMATIDELMKIKTRPEIAQELADLPYNEREKRRKEIYGEDIAPAERAQQNKRLQQKMNKPVGR